METHTPGFGENLAFVTAVERWRGLRLAVQDCVLQMIFIILKYSPVYRMQGGKRDTGGETTEAANSGSTEQTRQQSPKEKTSQAAVVAPTNTTPTTHNPT